MNAMVNVGFEHCLRGRRRVAASYKCFRDHVRYGRCYIRAVRAQLRYSLKDMAIWK